MLTVQALVSSCSEDKRSYVENIGDGEFFPSMITDSVKTFISDSGYTRYYIEAPIWKMYDRAQEPFWKFDQGLELQTFDASLNPESYLRCDSAIYWTRLKRWRLDGHVEMLNTAQDSFLTSQLFYDDYYGKVYTDSFIHIVKTDRILEGYGFVSNKDMSEYSLNRPTAIIPTATLRVDKDRAGTQADSSDVKSDSTATAPRIRPRPERASMRIRDNF